MRSMNYNQARAKYWKKKIENPLPPLPEDERIYLNVPYMARDFARYSHCGFDPDRKLWFTGCMNANLYFLVDLYGVNEATSEKALALMKAKLDEVAEVIRKRKEGFSALLSFWVQGVALPLGEPRVLMRSVKTHKGLLLTKVTKPCIMDSIERKI